MPTFYQAQLQIEMTSQNKAVETAQPGTSNNENIQSDEHQTKSIPSASKDIPICLSTVSPQEIRPFPKAGERKNNKKGKKPMKSCILTSTPVKKRMDKAAEEKEAKRKVKEGKVKKRLCKMVTNDTKENKMVKKKKEEETYSKEKDQD